MAFVYRELIGNSSPGSFQHQFRQLQMTLHNHQQIPVPTFHAKTKAVHVIIESPKGSRNKYVYEEKSGLLRLKKVLPAGMSFPFNFGFVPGTRGGDGDPLDGVILFDEPLVPGSFVRGRILGAILATQKRKAGYADRCSLPPSAGGPACLAFDAVAVEFCVMKAVSFRELKRQKAHRRMALARQAARSPRDAAAIQQCASLVGSAKWRITNLNEVARAIANWA